MIRLLPRRVQTVLRRGRIAVPAGWYSARILTWAVLLPVLKARLPLGRLVRFMWTAPRSGLRYPDEEARIVRLTGWLYRPRHVGPQNCLERSLILYRLLAGAGAGPHLIVAAGRGTHRWPGHAWVLVDGQPVGENRADLCAYVPIAAFGPAGQRVPLPPAADA